MKTIHFNFTKVMSVLLITLASSFTASAYDENGRIILDGFEYQLSHDPNDPTQTSQVTVSLVGREWLWDSVGEFATGWRPIQYDDWNTDSILILPSMVEGYPLTSITGGFWERNDIKTVNIPPTVTFIASGTFSKSSLESIVFSWDGEYDHAEPITFGDGESGVFGNCQRLTTVYFDRPTNKLSNFLFINCPNLKTVCFCDQFFNLNGMAMDTIGACAFFNCYSLTNFEIPNSVKVIDDGAFAYCTGLESVNIPNGLTSIGDFAFAECHQLDGITLNPSLQSIGKGAFVNCWSLTNMSIPESITTVNDFTFYDCHSLTKLDLNNVTTFGDYSFDGCNNLPSIDLSKAESIGLEAFFGGRVICSVWDHPISHWRPYLDIALRYEAFDQPECNLGSLKKITLGSNVSVLYERTFFGHIPDTITCMAPVPPSYSSNFSYDCIFSDEAYNNTTLCVPKVLVNDYREAYGWCQFAHIEGITIMGNGDVNCDGRISISDITSLINMILSGQNGTSNPVNADTNGDGKISIGDVTKLIDMLLQSP